MCAVSAYYIERGYFIYAPIAHSYNIANYLNNKEPNDFDTWRDQDFHMLARADDMWVLALPEWEKSYGIQEELIFWKNHTDKEPMYIDVCWEE